MTKEVSGTAETKKLDYYDGIEYLNDAFSALYHSEGRVVQGENGVAFEYFIKDHLGNTRVTFFEMTERFPTTGGMNVRWTFKRRNRKADGLQGTIQKDTMTEEVLQEHHYYPFGLEWTGDWRSYPDPQDQANAYRYNGKELHSEVLKQLDDVDVTLGLYSYGARFYDPSVGRFIGVDPLAEKMPAWSTYSYVFDNPIKFIDPDGAIPYPITIRSFAPFKTFGGGFHGDNRGYSKSTSASARVHQKINFDTDKTSLSTNVWSSPSWHKWRPGFKRTASPSVEIGNFAISNSGDSKTFNFDTHYAGANPLTPGAPPIDVFSDFSITSNTESGTLDISGKLTGDNFPSTEAFISDPSGQSIFLGIGFYEGSPFTSLWGDNKDNPITSFSFSITTDSDGNFTGIRVGETNYSIADWNKLFELADPDKNANK